MITDPIQTRRALLAWQAPLSEQSRRAQFAECAGRGSGKT